jgi:mitochondrial-processing peptidase subunit beta
MTQQNLGVFYNAPSWRDPDFFAFLLLQRIFGNFTQESYFETMIDVETQNNTMHECLKHIPDLARYDAIYSPYSDCGIFGHYF